MAIQHSHGDGGQGHQQQEGQHDPGQQDGELELAGLVAETAGNGFHDPGSIEDSQQDDQTQDNRQEVDDQGGQTPGSLGALALQCLGEGGNESRTHGPFGKKIPQKVGDPECDVEGVGLKAGEQSQQKCFPYQSQDPADDGRKADQPGGFH